VQVTYTIHTEKGAIFTRTYSTFGAALEALYNYTMSEIILNDRNRNIAPWIRLDISPSARGSVQMVEIETSATYEHYGIEEHYESPNIGSSVTLPHAETSF